MLRAGEYEMTASTLFVSSSSGGAPGHRGTIMRFNLDAGKVSEPFEGHSSLFPSPSFMVWSGIYKKLYLTSEMPEGPGLLTGISTGNNDFQPGESVSAGANAAVHLCLDRREKHIFF